MYVRGIFPSAEELPVKECGPDPMIQEFSLEPELGGDTSQHGKTHQWKEPAVDQLPPRSPVTGRGRRPTRCSSTSDAEVWGVR